MKLGTTGQTTGSQGISAPGWPWRPCKRIRASCLKGWSRPRVTRLQPEREALVEYILDHSDQQEWFESLIGTFVPPSAREAGVRNDLQQLRTLNELPLEQIVVPTLIVHGTADKVIPISESEAMAARIPGATFIAVEGAGHLVELGPKAAEVQSKILEFLRERSAGQFPR